MRKLKGKISQIRKQYDKSSFLADVVVILGMFFSIYVVWKLLAS